MRPSLPDESSKHQRPFILFAVGLLAVCAGAVGWLFIARPASKAPVPIWAFPRPPIERVKAPLPPRFSAPLPQHLEGFWDEVEKGPPLSYVRARLLEQEPPMQEQYLAALRQAASETENVAALWDTYGQALWPYSLGDITETEYRVSVWDAWEPPCGWLVERAVQLDTEVRQVRRLLWRTLPLCPGPEVEALLAREDAHPERVFEQFKAHGGPRLTEALHKAVRRVLEEDRQELFGMAAMQLSSVEEPAARGLAAELERQARGEVVEALQRSPMALQREEQYLGRLCASIPSHAEGLEYLRVLMCLPRWVRADWPATARLAQALAEDPLYSRSEWDEFATLTRFSSLAEQDAWARERGLLPPPPAEPEGPPKNLSLFWRLDQAGRAFHFRPNYPGDSRDTWHDELLVTLAWKVRPELRGVVFEEVPLKRDDVTGTPVGPSVLHAYVDGERFSLEARPHQDWTWDMDAALALLSRVLEARGSSTRFALMDYASSQANVVFGPGPALQEAHVLGLWRLGEARTAIVESPLRRQLLQGMQRIPPQAPR